MATTALVQGAKLAKNTDAVHTNEPVNKKHIETQSTDPMPLPRLPLHPEYSNPGLLRLPSHLDHLTPLPDREAPIMAAQTATSEHSWDSLVTLHLDF